MAWIRLSDDYINDEKIFALSDGSFRLWHEGMAYCRRQQTDGSIPFTIMRGLRSYTKGREKQLSTPVREGVAPLWELVPAMGYRVHNYLDWNLSKEEASNERAGTAARMRKFRERKKPPSDGACDAVTVGVTNANVLVRKGRDPDLGSLERERERKPSVGSRWPIFKGNRLVVFDWMLTQMQATLGPYAESMEWDTWLDSADQRALKEPVVASDWWPWLQAELLIYARGQGWMVAVPQAAQGKLTTKLATALANIAREAQS